MLIVIEGIDGSGKGTQSQLLVERLNQRGEAAKLFSLPFYEETFFGREVGKYLNGGFGSLDTVPVEFAAMLYAGDRFEKKTSILEALENGGIAVCDRYVPSNLAHQAAKLPEDQQGALIRWIADLEYGVYALPRPDMVFFLDMPVKSSTAMVLKKKKRSYTDEKLDLHEADSSYLQKVAYTFKMLAHDEQWDAVQCMQGDSVRSIEDISNEIFERITVRLTERPRKA